MSQNQNPPAHIVELIRTSLQHRGSGTSTDPTRTVEQFWTRDGQLAAENDSFHPNETACKAVKVMLKDRGFDPPEDHLALPESVATALDSLQEIIKIQKENIAKLQEQIHPCEKTPKTAAKKSGT